MTAGFPLPSVRAVTALSRSDDWARVAWRALGDAARERSSTGGRAGTYASEIGLAREAGVTPLGNVVDVLERGPQNVQERDLARSIAGSAVRHALTTQTGSVDEIVKVSIWLAAHSAFDASAELATHSENEAVTRALAECAGDATSAVPGMRGESIVAAAVLSAMPEGPAASHVRQTATDPLVRRMLSANGRASSSAAAGAGASGAKNPPVRGSERIEGDVERGPRAPWATTVLALSGVLFVIHVVRLVARFALRYRRSGEISLEGGQLHVHTKIEMLGRTLKESEATMPAAGLRRLARETTYPRLAFYGGLVSLSIGTAIGVWFLADGVRAASPTLLGWGLVAIVLGGAIDFWASSLSNHATGTARLVVEPVKGAGFSFVGPDAARIDEFLRAAL